MKKLYYFWQNVTFLRLFGLFFAHPSRRRRRKRRKTQYSRR